MNCNTFPKITTKLNKLYLGNCVPPCIKVSMVILSKMQLTSDFFFPELLIFNSIINWHWQCTAKIMHLSHVITTFPCDNVKSICYFLHKTSQFTCVLSLYCLQKFEFLNLILQMKKLKMLSDLCVGPDIFPRTVKLIRWLLNAPTCSYFCFMF